MFRSGQTPTAGTGPLAGSGGGGIYAHTEDTDSNSPAVNLLSPCIDISSLSNPTLLLSIQSHNLLGPGDPTENTLSVDIYDGNGVETTDLIGPIGHLGGFEFVLFRVSLAPFASPVRFRFRGRTDNGSVTHDLCIDDVQVIDPLEGTLEDFVIGTRATATQVRSFPMKEAYAGQFLSVQLSSPDGTFNGVSPLLVGELFPDGSLPAPIGQGFIVSLGAALIFVGPNTNFGLGPVILGPGGLTLTYPVPPGLGAASLLLQGLISTSTAANAIYATTDAHIIDLY